MIDLRLGDYREVMQDVEPDAVICDPATHAKAVKRLAAGYTPGLFT